MSKPKEYYFVERVGGKFTNPYGFRASKHSQGNGGGTLRTLKAAQQRKASIQWFYPDAKVTIYRGDITWVELS